jgi:carboxyl-terminal processing protease
MSLKLEGIGAMLRSEDEYTKVVRLIHAGPAFKQGDLSPSDRIVGVAQETDKEITDVIGWRLDEVVNLIRGKKGTTVTLEVIPSSAKTDDERQLIKITRDVVKLEEQAVQKAMIDVKDDNGITRKYGVIDIPTFYMDFNAYSMGDPNYKSTTRDVQTVLNELINDGAEGIIIDLRNNGGGSLAEANQLVWLFIERGPTVQIKYSSSRVRADGKQHYSPYYKGPLVVLMNRMSASASEIFAGAMQDYGRAIIAGSDSFGKGTVQSRLSLAHGSIKLTEQKFYRISGGSTQNKGVIPDIKLPEIYDKSKIGENALKTALPWDQIAPARYNPHSDLESFVPKLQESSAKRTNNNPDFLYIEQLSEYRDASKKNELSLNEKQRLTEVKEDESYRLKLLNSKLNSKGEATYNTFDDWEKFTEEKQEKEDQVAQKAIDFEDAYLLESASILTDFIKLTKEAMASH